MVMLLIVVMVLPAAGNVLCIGPNGHAAIEPVHSGDSCDEVADHASASDDHFVEVATEDCVDLPLVTVTWMPRPEQERDVIAFHRLSPVYLIDFASVASPKSACVSRRLNRGSVPEFLLSLRSTVLLL